MKKILTSFLVVLLLLLTSCLPAQVEHPIRDVPTETEYQELVEQLRDSTVNLIGYYMNFELTIGSGLIYDKEPLDDGKFYYYVLTNNHVVESMTHMMVKTNQGHLELGDIYAFPISKSDTDDIGIVRFESRNEYPLIDILPLNTEQNIHLHLSVGQTVFGIGTPISKENFNLTTDLGIISNLSGSYISHTANINPGNSGGPLFSYDGTFIGVNTQRVEVINDQTVYLVGDAIHVNKVTEVIKKRIDEVTPKLGIIIAPYNNFIGVDYVKYYGEKAKDFDPYDHVPSGSSGAVVIEINATRPSFGIFERFDLIQVVNGISITDDLELSEAIGKIQVGQTYTFEVLRLNLETSKFEKLELEVTIG